MAQDAAMLLITCGCGQRMKVPAEALGKTATCVRCGERLRITVETADPSDWGTDSDPGFAPSNEESTELSAKGQDPVHVLRQHGLVDAEAIGQATLVQRDIPRKTWDLLIELGHVSVDDFHAIMAKQKGYASIDLPNYNIPREVVELVPSDIAHRGVLIPVDKLGKLLTLAMACPLDVEIISEVEEHTGLKVKPMLSRLDHLRDKLSVLYDSKVAHNAVDDAGAEGDAGAGGYASEEARGYIEPLLKSNEVARRVYALESLAPFIQTSERLKSTLDSGANAGLLQTVTETVATDPVATGLVLRVSNSEAYGFKGRVDGLGLACTLLGSEGTCSVVNSVKPRDYGASYDDFDFDAYWKRAQFCSEAAQTIAGAMNSQVAINAYTAGLLHDIGRLALLTVLPKGYPELTRGLSGPQRTKIESQTYRLTSIEAGYLLASRWGFPESVAEPIRCQRDPKQARKAPEVTSIVALAVLMADAHEMGDSPSLDQAEELLAELGLGAQVLGEVFQETVANAADSISV